MNMKKKRERKNKGITLIALVITIIVLLILAGVSIAMLTGESGILGKANSAASQTKKAKYIEDVKIVIMEAKLDMDTGTASKGTKIAKVTNRGDRGDRGEEETTEEKVFISVLETRIPDKLDWVKEVEMSDEEGIKQTDEIEKNNLLIITSEDNYEIIVKVDNGNNTATVDEEKCEEAKEKCKISFDGNEGTGTMEEIEVRKGFYRVLPESGYTRTYYLFKGWNTKKDGTGTSYLDKKKIQVQESMTLYAQWESTDSTPPTVVISMSNSSDHLFALKSTIEISDATEVDYSRCKYVYTDSKTELGTDESKYTEGTIEEATTNIEKAKGAKTWYLHVLATDIVGNSAETISDTGITIASVQNYEYTGAEQTANLLAGNYKLEVWGAEGR